MESGEQRRFWDEHIGEWSASAYEKNQKLPFIERIAQPWRKHLQLRENMAIDIVERCTPNKVIELGCGTGEFASAVLKACPSIRRYAAFDISETAVTKARERVLHAAGPNVNATVNISSVEDLDPVEFRDFDVLVGLGLLPYLTDLGFEKLAAIGRDKPYLLDYHPKEPNVFNGIHYVYRRVKRYPFYRMFTEPELVETMARYGFAKFEFIRRGPLRFMKSL
jgi:SAM-dependent methyltransferase